MAGSSGCPHFCLHLDGPHLSLPLHPTSTQHDGFSITRGRERHPENILACGHGVPDPTPRAAISEQRECTTRRATRIHCRASPTSLPCLLQLPRCRDLIIEARLAPSIHDDTHDAAIASPQESQPPEARPSIDSSRTTSRSQQGHQNVFGIRRFGRHRLPRRAF